MIRKPMSVSASGHHRDEIKAISIYARITEIAALCFGAIPAPSALATIVLYGLTG